MSPDESSPPTFLSTPRGRLTLLLFCMIGFLDFIDGSIVNVALPSIRHSLHFSVQNLQWVVSGYTVTYGGLLLLGGRAGDLTGRRRLLIAGTALFGISSLFSGFAQTQEMLVIGRLVQGVGAAMMSPAALSLLTTTFSDGTDRLKALGAWGAVSGLAGLLGVVLGGVFADGPGWRWVFFVNPPVCAVILLCAVSLLPDDRRRARIADVDTLGGLLGTASVLLLLFGLVRAPSVGWGATATIAELAGAAALAIAFLIFEARHPHPLVPFAIFRIRGLAAANLTQLIAFAGFVAMFFFVTLYMQNVLHYSPLQAGLAYIPAATGVVIAAGICSNLFARTGTRPLLVIGALFAAAGMLWLSRAPEQGHYLPDLLPGLIVMGLGLGAVVVGVQTAANAGVPENLAGLAAALITACFQIGVAVGLAVFSAIATGRTHALLHTAHATPVHAQLAGYQLALFVAGLVLVSAAVVATRATNTRGEPVSGVEDAVAALEPVLDLQPELEPATRV